MYICIDRKHLQKTSWRIWELNVTVSFLGCYSLLAIKNIAGVLIAWCSHSMKCLEVGLLYQLCDINY